MWHLATQNALMTVENDLKLFFDQSTLNENKVFDCFIFEHINGVIGRHWATDWHRISFRNKIFEELFGFPDPKDLVELVVSRKGPQICKKTSFVVKCSKGRNSDKIRSQKIKVNILKNWTQTVENSKILASIFFPLVTD